MLSTSLAVSPSAAYLFRRDFRRSSISRTSERSRWICQVCRLRDVYELLLDTGIGRDGYSVIGQGRIAEIVAAKSSERREIFEEACGIAKYRYRKTEAERRLAAAGENLERLRDILGELESRVGPLEKESAKAQKFLELSEQRKTLEVTLWTDSVHRARDTVRQQVRDYETAQADYERFDGEAKAAELKNACQGCFLRFAHLYAIKRLLHAIVQQPFCYSSVSSVNSPGMPHRAARPTSANTIRDQMEALPPSSQPTKSNWNKPTRPQLMPPTIIRIRQIL